MRKIKIINILMILVIFTVLTNCVSTSNNNNINFKDNSNYTFRVKWDGRYIDGITKLSGIKKTIEVVLFSEGGDTNSANKIPGRTSFSSITMERIRTKDDSFEAWSNKITNYGVPQSNIDPLTDFRKDIIIDIFNNKSEKEMSFKFFRCWPSNYTAIAEMHTNGPIIESITIENEGWISNYYNAN